jgi:hypothetical protein
LRYLPAVRLLHQAVIAFTHLHRQVHLLTLQLAYLLNTLLLQVAAAVAAQVALILQQVVAEQVVIYQAPHLHPYKAILLL